MPFCLSRRWITSTIAAVSLAACNNSTEALGGASLRLAQSGSAPDTANGEITLVAEVHDASGRAAPAGTVVAFASATGYNQVQFPAAAAFPGGGTTTLLQPSATGVTDASGRTAVPVKLATAAGAARVVVTVPSLGLEDTARITIDPGNAVRVRATPADTVLYVGRSFTASGGIVDRWGNPRTDPVTWSSSSPGLTVTAAGVVTANALGRYQIKGTGGLDAGSVSVVPQGRFVADNAGVVYAVDVDGSNRTTLANVNDGGIGVHPAWIPGTSAAVYTTNVGGTQQLQTVGTDGVPKPFFATSPPGVTHQAQPTPTADGKWLYFVAFDTRCAVLDYCVSRARIDGSGEELLVTTASRNPSPSPDGSQVAYVELNNVGTIKVFDVASRTVSSWSVAGRAPAWSPDGTQIAFVSPDGRVASMSPDGTPIRSIPKVGAAVSALFGWTPDGKWLIVQTSEPGFPGTMAFMDPVTGTLLPLPYSTGKALPSMK